MEKKQQQKKVSFDSAQQNPRTCHMVTQSHRGRKLKTNNWKM